MSKLKPDDIFETYGAFNDLTVGGNTPVGSRRTLTTTEALSGWLENFYTPDVLEGKSVYDGVVMASIASNTPTLQSNQALIEFLSDPPEEILYYLYKVYIPEVEPRCINFSDRGTASGGFTNAQRVMTLPNAVMDASVPASENMRAIEAGTYVQVIFANQEKLKNPKIVAIGKKIIELKGRMFQSGSLKTQFSSNRGTSPGGRGVAVVPGVGPSPPVGPPVAKSANRGPKLSWSDLKKLQPYVQPLMDKIAESESHGDYDIANRLVNRDGNNVPVKTSITEVFGKNYNNVTIGEIIEMQTSGGRGTKIFATGKYQQTPPTLVNIIDQIGANGSAATNDDAASLKKLMYSKENQDLIPLTNLLWKQGRVGHYMGDKHDDAAQAAQSIAYEWAGVPIQYTEVHKRSSKASVHPGAQYPLNKDKSSQGIPLVRGMSYYEQTKVNTAKKGAYVQEIYNEVIATKQRIKEAGVTHLLA